MQFDRRQLDKILSLDDESFKALAKTIAEATGANKAKADFIVNNPDFLKRKLSSISPYDAQQLIESAGKEKSQEIYDMLKQRGVNFGQ